MRVDKFGVLDTTRIDETSVGRILSIGQAKFLVLDSGTVDRIETIRRKAQIILPKDAASIILSCDIRSGCTVVEGGAGSGALTIALASFVHPGGKVISYEAREEFLEIAQDNVEKAGIADVVEFRLDDVTRHLEESTVDAVVLDIPNPWDALGGVHRALRPGGHFASYVPTMNQVERTVHELQKLPFVGIRSTETLEREIEVGEMGTRPSFKMLGHTGYLTFARKVESRFP